MSISLQHTTTKGCPHKRWLVYGRGNSILLWLATLDSKGNMRYCALSQFTEIPLKSRHCSLWPGLSQYSGGWREEVEDLWLWYVPDGGSWGSHLCEDQHREAALEMVGHWIHSQQRVYHRLRCVGLWSSVVGDWNSRWVYLQTYTVWTSSIHPVLTINVCTLCRWVSLPSHC